MTTNNETKQITDGAPAPKEPRPKSAALTVQGWMSSPTMSAALSAALGGYMDFKTFAAQCYITAQDPKLAACSAESMMKSFLEVAQMGMLPGPAHKHVALVPRNGVITVTPEWRGYKFVMERQDGIKRVRPILVHKSDVFSTTGGSIVHEYDPFDDARVFEHPDVAKAAKRECQLRGGYLEIAHDTGEVEYHFVSAAKIERNRACAETQKLWMKWFEEQCLKTVVRDAFSKRVISINPELGARLAAADDADNRALGNDPARGGTATPSLPSSRTASIAAQLGAAEDTPDMTRAATAEVIDATVEPVAS